MGKLIDADALKDWLEIVPLTGDGGVDINDLESWIAQQPTANAWIPCSERLPDEDCLTGANVQYSVPVLMTAYNAEDEETIVDYGHTVDGRWYSDTTDLFVPSWWEVLAWMPLPEPWKGKE